MYRPEDLRSGFLVRSREESEDSVLLTKETDDSRSREESEDLVLSTKETDSSREFQENYNASDESIDQAMNDLTRIFISYDMGWSKRGSGRQYDSLNGYASIIGTQSGKVLDFATRNRECRLCYLGKAKKKHDCRLNFNGSAKAMEPDTAAQLAANSTILKSQNVQVGVFIGDDDSSSICAVRNACSHPVVKHSDKNHTSRGVTNMLYKIDKRSDANKELTSEAIKYLHRCFTYAVSQNPGNPDNLAAAIRNIPFHAFNMHDNCGDWCNYSKDPENYTHSTVLGGFQNERLFEELKELFNKLANNAEKFSTGASSQANESLNNIMLKKAPKAVCYSLSESADFRYASAVAQKNYGEKYVEEVYKYYELSPGSHLSKHVERCAKSARIRSTKAKTPLFKARRRALRKQRSQLRNRRDHLEGETYSSHIGLLSMPAVETDRDTSSTELPSLANNFDHDNNSTALVFFDLETAGLKLTCEVLQVAMKCGSTMFNEYIRPNENISLAASKVNGLTNEGHDLFLHGRSVPAKPLHVVANELLQFLKGLQKPCVLIAHNCAFDAPRLIRLINQVGLVTEFIHVIDGFVDTLPLFRNKFPGEDCSLVKLAARNFALHPEKAHDAMYDVVMLQNVAFYNFTVDELLTSNKKYVEMLQYDKNFKSLVPLSNSVSNEIRKRMANAGISYVLLQHAYSQGKEEIISLLEKKENGKKQVIKTKKMLNIIISHFEELLK
ncbi:uncharacterized protein [Temnothorax longispinosus]|uniref:uncharacterized protein n=1 Tax=Temnothorax longispinosus TaxID=300112 RepID=UPI003A992AAF